MKKENYLLFLFVAIIFTYCSNSGNDSKQQQNKKNREYVLYDNPGMTNLQNSFEDTMVIISDREIKRKKFPEYYGGAYIDNDQRTLVIILTGNSTKRHEEEFKSRVGNHPVRFQKGRFSFNELQSINDKLYEFVTNNKDKEFVRNIIGWGTYDDKNAVYISLEDSSESIINEIKEKFMDTDAIKFEKSERPRDL